MDDLKKEKLGKAIVAYFDDFFDEAWFWHGYDNGRPLFTFAGTRNDTTHRYSVDADFYIGNDVMLYHFLENIKGNILREEETIILEK